MSSKGKQFSFNYGVIEGFFGETWTWGARKQYVQFFKDKKFGFYIYAPKSDKILRENWIYSWPDVTYEKLYNLREIYKIEGIDWGLGFSPYHIYRDYNSEKASLLDKKINYLNRLQPDILAILLDDMHGELSNLAEIQVEIVNRIVNISTAKRFIFCPTYYSDDHDLDMRFGNRPLNYLETLGRKLDSQIDIFWTGDKVCSQGFSIHYLHSVANRIGRKPFIWDNYPVNDKHGMNKFLHLRGFKNRPYQMADLTSGHAINPMNQAFLSQIPLSTLFDLYTMKEDYNPEESFFNSVVCLCGYQFAKYLLEDLTLFQDRGLDKIDRLRLAYKYEPFHNAYSSEKLSGWEYRKKIYLLGKSAMASIRL